MNRKNPIDTKSSVPKGISGGVTLLILMVLLLATALLMGLAHKSLMFEQLSSAHQHRSQKAFDAAEAGLAWTLAQLNRVEPINTQCDATNAPDGVRFRDRLTAGAFTAHCVQNETQGWNCQCPSPGQPINPTPAFSAAVPLSFEVGLQPDSQPHHLQISSIGCLGGQVCQKSGGSALPEATVQTKITVGHIPALSLKPRAALTIHGAADLTQAVWKIDPPEAPTWAILAAGNVKTSPPQTQLKVLDFPLKEISSPEMFKHLFHMEKAAFQNLPTVLKIPCQNGCDAALQNAVISGHAMLWLEGGLYVRQSLVLGSEQEPILLVVDGPIRFDAQVTIHGLIYSTSPDWHDSSLLGSALHGAVVLEGDLVAHGLAHIHHNTAILERLHRQQGTYVKVTGSWRDF
jgi:hypothetical protein